MSNDDTRVAALAALYESDRSDNMGTANAVMAVVAGAIAYVGLTSLAGDPNQKLVGPALFPFLPLPLWALVIYHAMLVGVSMARANSILLLEGALVREAGLSEVVTLIGLHGTEPITNPREKRATWQHRLSAVIVNSIFGVFALAYTCLCLVRGYHAVGIVPFCVLAVIYVALIALVVVSWLASIRLMTGGEQTRKERSGRD